MQETQVRSLGQDLLEKAMATHSSILVWEIPQTEEPGGLQSIGLQRIEHNWSNLVCPQTEIWVSLVAQMVKKSPAMQETWVWILGSGSHPGEENGFPIHYSCLENSMQRGPLGWKEWDATEWLTLSKRNILKDWGKLIRKKESNSPTNFGSK